MKASRPAKKFITWEEYRLVKTLLAEGWRIVSYGTSGVLMKA